MMVSYKDLCKVRIMNNPCPLCGNRLETKDAKFVVVSKESTELLNKGYEKGDVVQVCKTHGI